MQGAGKETRFGGIWTKKRLLIIRTYCRKHIFFTFLISRTYCRKHIKNKQLKILWKEYFFTFENFGKLNRQQHHGVVVNVWKISKIFFRVSIWVWNFRYLQRFLSTFHIYIPEEFFYPVDVTTCADIGSFSQKCRDFSFLAFMVILVSTFQFQMSVFEF